MTFNDLFPMKHLLYLLLFLSFNAAAASDAQWIWQKADGPLNTWMAFRKEITPGPSTQNGPRKNRRRQQILALDQRPDGRL